MPDQPAARPAAPAPDPLRDRVVAAVGDRYDVHAEVGRGAAGVVYRATEVRLQRTVALKVLPPELAYRAGVRERFLREAQTAAGLAHPHIVPVYAAGDDGGVAWLAMAFVDGDTLGARLARSPRAEPADAARVLAEVADALAYAHARGVVHRDVKPDNVLLERNASGAPGRVLVTDFGIARAAEEDLRLTATGATLGTPAYMSPEQALGESRVDGRSDQYALAVVGYQLLTGVLPFQAASATAMLMKHVGEVPRPVRERAPEVPPALAAAVERALAKRPDDRWPDAGAFRDAVRAAAVGAAPNGAFPAPYGDPRHAPRHGGRSARDDRADAAATRAPDAQPPYGVGLGGAFPMPPGPVSPREWREAQREWNEHLREERREQRERAREWGEYAREQWRDQRDQYREAAAAGAAGLPVPIPPTAPLPYQYGAGAPNGYANGYPAGGIPPLPLEVRADRFRGKAIGSFALIAFLAVINAMHLFVPPWVAFPAWGILGDLRRRWRPLGEAGLDFWDVVFHGREALTRVAGAAGGPSQLERRARRTRRRARTAVAFVSAAFLMAGLGLTSGQPEFMIPMLIFGVLAFVLGLGAARGATALRRAGVPFRTVMGHGWRDAVAAAEPRPRPAVLAEEARRLAGDAVLDGPYGAAVRGAIDDREAVRGIVAGLSPADRALVPVGDVNPTVDGLVERVADLAQRLHAIERDAAPGALAALDARLAAARAGAATPESERTVALLERQRASLAELAQRRDELAQRMESARAALHTLRLDFLKLREGGVGALGGVGSATQEARALSREIGYALEAAGEVRGAR